jgi:hypothetical protein
MAAVENPRLPLADGAAPLCALLGVTLVFQPLNDVAYGLAALYMTFAAAMATGGGERPGEPALPWRVYAMGTAALAVIVPLTAFRPDLRFLELIAVGLLAAGFVVHVVLKLRHGAVRVGILSACGRRAHDARVGRTLEAAALVMAAATVTEGVVSPALYATAAWLITAAAVAERPTTEREAQPLAAAPARVA